MSRLLPRNAARVHLLQSRVSLSIMSYIWDSLHCCVTIIIIITIITAIIIINTTTTIKVIIITTITIIWSVLEIG